MNGVTLRELARLTGYSLGTVSMALRDDPRVSAGTRRLVQDEALRAGYRPEPVIRDFMTRVRSGDGARQDVSLVYLLPWGRRAQHDAQPSFRRFLAGAKARAEDGGYRLSEYLLSEIGAGGRVLQARGVSGVIVAPAEGDTEVELALSLEHCAAVSIGYSVRAPVLSRVVHDHAGGVEMALAELVSGGHARIGCVLGEVVNRRVRGRWLGAFEVARSEALANRLLPPLLLPSNGGRDVFLAWLARHRPDALLASDWGQVEDWLAEAGLRAPEDLSGVSMDWGGMMAGGAAGVDQMGERIGAAAVDFLLDQIHRHERGGVPPRRTLLIEGAWRAGRSVRPRT